MSASACLVFYGVRVPAAWDDVEALESGAHPLLRAAAKAGLDAYWANFGAGDEVFYVFVGRALGQVGPEHDRGWALSVDAVPPFAAIVDRALADDLAMGEPRLWFQWRHDN